MKVTLIYSALGIAGFNANRQPGDREGSWIGHGIASIGAATKAAGHEVDLIDLRQLSGWEEFADNLLANPAEVYGISVAPVDYQFVLQEIYWILKCVPKAKIIVGGIHPTIFPDKYNYAAIDCVVQGEGEITFPQILKDINNLPRVVVGEKPDLDKIPWVDRELFDYRRELTCNFAPGQRMPSITMLAGRGCPFKCAYCQPAENAVFGTPFRIRSPYNVISEMEMLYKKYGFNSITFWDDTFTFSREFVMQFCTMYQDTEMFAAGVKIAACSRADIICNKPDMIEYMAASGIDWLVIGFESGSQRMLDLIKKGTTVKQNLRAAEICKSLGIKIFGTFMLGLPTETREETQQTVRMINTIQPEMPSPFWYTPIPGTDLYKYCDNNDLILNKNDTIARTGQFRPTLKGIDYQYLRSVMADNAAAAY